MANPTADESNILRVEHHVIYGGRDPRERERKRERKRERERERERDDAAAAAVKCEGVVF